MALLWPDHNGPAAVLGAVVVVLTGLRQVFHWHENLVRFNNACHGLLSELRRYNVGDGCSRCIPSSRAQHHRFPSRFINGYETAA